jgi:hypothetical protein
LVSTHAWSAKHVAANEWLTIDCGKPCVVAGIVTAPRRASSRRVVLYSVSTSDDRDGVYVPADGGYEFSGNVADVDAEVSRFFQTPVLTRYVRIEVRAWVSYPSLRAALLLQPDPRVAPDVILNPNENYRFASSAFQDSVFGSGYNRGTLGSAGGWASKRARVGEWYGLDCARVVNVTGVVTQNRHDAQHQSIVKYKVSTSVDGEEGPFTSVDDGFVFDGNAARGDGTLTRYFSKPVEARFVRIEVVAYQGGHPAMRAGVTILPPDPGTLAIDSRDATGVPRVSDAETLNPNEHNRYASSVWDDDAPGTGHMRGSLDSPMAWVAKYRDTKKWYVIDAGESRIITGVVLQSRADLQDQMVTSFSVSVSDALDGEYADVDGGVAFAGNRAWGNGKVLREFAKPVTGRFVKIAPKTWSKYISMRAGLEVVKKKNALSDLEL